MGLLYQKKHDEEENDGKTAIFTDFFTAPPVSAPKEEKAEDETNKDNEKTNKE